MVVITNKDDVQLHTNKIEVAKIVGVLMIHLAIALIMISFIANFMLKASFIAATISTVLISGVMLTSAIWIALRWVWSRMSVNGKRYRFAGKISPLLGMVIAITCLMVSIEAALGVGAVMILSSNYVWWQLILTGLLLSLMVIGLLRIVGVMKKWTQRNVVPVA